MGGTADQGAGGHALAIALTQSSESTL
ncbi:hypothetical protein [Mycobacterium sp. JS623]